MSEFTFELGKESLYLRASDGMDVSDDIYVKADTVPKPLWDKALRYDMKLKALMGQMKQYSV